MKEKLQLFLQDQWQNHFGRTAGLLLGTLFGVSVLLFGVWRVLFVLLCAGIGMLIGLRAERVGNWTELIDTGALHRLFRRMS